MARLSRWLAGGVVVSALGVITLAALGDETSTGDKLRIQVCHILTVAVC